MKGGVVGWNDCAPVCREAVDPNTENIRCTGIANITFVTKDMRIVSCKKRGSL